MYTAVILSEKDRAELLQRLSSMIPEGWQIIADHMTIKMGKAPDVKLGKDVVLTVKAYSQNDLAAAVAVEGDVPCNNQTKHITVAVNRKAGGKPVHSNELKDWMPIKEFQVRGVVEEVK